MGLVKKTSIIILAVFAVIGGGFLIGGASLQASAHDSYNMVEGEKEGHIIQTDTEIINIFRLETFYKNFNRRNDDHIIIAIPQSGSKYELYELVFSNEKLKLYYDVIEDGQGRKEYKVKVYDSIKKIYKDNQVTYILVNDKEERSFLSYNLQ